MAPAHRRDTKASGIIFQWAHYGMTETFRFGEVTVEVRDGLTVTRLPDGGLVPAEHREQEGQAELAAAHGYDSAVELNRHHDLGHSLLRSGNLGEIQRQSG